MNIDEAKSIPLDDFLENLGYVCTGIKSGCKWYRVREERTASFKLSRDKRAFYDHGIGKGGNIVDLAEWLGETSSVSDSLKFIEKTMGGGYTIQVQQRRPPVIEPPKYKLISKKPFNPSTRYGMTDAALYLKTRRGIDPFLFAPYLSSVQFYHIDHPKKKRYGFGLINDKGGCNIRTQIMGKWEKRTIYPNGSTYFDALPDKAMQVFYSLMDFGTFLTVYKPKRGDFSYLIINGDALAGSALACLDDRPPGYAVHWPHPNASGQDAFRTVLDGLTERGWEQKDRQHHYEGFDDFTAMREVELGLDKNEPMQPYRPSSKGPRLNY